MTDCKIRDVTGLDSTVLGNHFDQPIWPRRDMNADLRFVVVKVIVASTLH